MKILDLFCGAGGAAMGYHQALDDLGIAHTIIGVDVRPMPRYPFTFVQGDALEYLAAHGSEYDFIHASPPCQGFSDLRHMPNAKAHPNLVEPVRRLLKASGARYVIENVEGAPLKNAIMLCGTMFGLGVGDAELWRHRLFETNGPLIMAPPCNHRKRERVIGVYGGHGRDRRRVITVVGGSGGRSNRDGTQQFSTAERRTAMGIDWMTNAELSQAIPPAYTRYIGRQLWGGQ